MRRVGPFPARPHTGRVNDDRRIRWPRLTITAMGLATTAVAAKGIINLAGMGDSDGGRSVHRTVVATVSPVPLEPPTEQQPVNPADVVEIPVRVDASPMAAAQPRIDLREITYIVDGNQRPDGPVTVVYADETGALRTVENVTLPWTMTIISSLPVNYVTANGRGSLLNCWITDASGAAVVSRTHFSTHTTCNR